MELRACTRPTVCDAPRGVSIIQIPGIEEELVHQGYELQLDLRSLG